MRKIVLTSFTPLGAGGGVPRWNRDFKAGFPEGQVKHYSWFDLLKDQNTKDTAIPEWDKARVLNQWLIWKKLVTKDDIILCDGFWTLGLEEFPHVVSVAHGNWSHTTKDDVEKGILPEFPQHHAVQVRQRTEHLKRGGRIVAVSDFIAHQCKIQWGFEMPVINNGIDLTKFFPTSDRRPRKKAAIIHGTTTANKGMDHIDHLRKNLDVDIALLEDSMNMFTMPGRPTLTKYQALSQADLVVHPSAHEGNSYFVLESLASGVPIISYNVGLMYQAGLEKAPIGCIIDRTKRSKENTLQHVSEFLNYHMVDSGQIRGWVSQFSLEKFQESWKKYLGAEFGL